MESLSSNGLLSDEAGAATPNFVWISLETGMQCRSHYYNYPIDRALHREDLEAAVHPWAKGTYTGGPGNFHLPDHLDSLLSEYISFENMFTTGTSTVSSLRGGFTGVPNYLHALAHTPKTVKDSSQKIEYTTIFEHLGKKGYQLAGFHLFKNTSSDFVIPDYDQGWNDEIRAWPDSHLTHYNYVTPAIRLENYLRGAGPGPHAICIHVYGQLTPAILEILEQHGISRQNSIILILGDHGHPNFDLDGRQALGAHDVECDAMNTQVYCRLAFPGSVPKRIEMECSTIDFMPTFACMLGFDAELPQAFHALLGSNLVPVLEGEASETVRTVRITSRYHAQLRSRITVLRREGWRYQYMHPDNVYLHDYHRLHGIKMHALESLYRHRGDGVESPVNVESRLVGSVLREFRRIRLELDAVIQRFWLHHLETKVDVPIDVFAMVESIDSTAQDQQKQISMSQEIDTRIRELAEELLNRRVDTISELKRIVDSTFYYKYLLTEFPEVKTGRIAIWDVDGGYKVCVKPIRDKLNARYIVVEDQAKWSGTLDGLPIRGPEALMEEPVDLVVICSPFTQLHETILKIRSLDLPYQPMIA